MYNISVDQIQCFKVLVEEGSFTQAALKLNRAKSAVRYAINNLEEQLGFKVIDRSSYRPRLTPQGESLLQRSKELIFHFDEFLESCSQIASHVETRLKISVSGIYGLNPLYPTLKKLMKKYPATEFILEREILSGEKMLRRGLVDLSFFEHLNYKKELDYKVIDRIDLFMVIAKNHPFTKLPKKDQKIENLYSYPQIIQRSTIPDEDFSHGIHHESLQWKVTDTLSKKEIILNGLGWGRLPRHEIEKELKSGKLVHLAHLNQDDETKIYICRRKGAYTGKVAEELWNSF